MRASRRWRNGDRVQTPTTGASGTVTAVRRGYIMVTWDELSRRRWPYLPERTKLGHENALRKL